MFRGVVSRETYARGVAIRIALFAAISVAFPFALDFAVRSTGCQGNTCLALSLAFSVVSKAIIFLVFVLSFMRTSARRLRDAGLPVPLILVLPILMLADLGFAGIIGSSWPTALSFLMTGRLPRYLLTALGCIAFLCLMPAGPSADESMGGRRDPVAIIALALLLLLTAISTLNFMAWAPIVGGLGYLRTYAAIIHAVMPVLQLLPYLLLLLPALLIWIVWRRHQPTSGAKNPAALARSPGSSSIQR